MAFEHERGLKQPEGHPVPAYWQYPGNPDLSMATAFNRDAPLPAAHILWVSLATVHCTIGAGVNSVEQKHNEAPAGIINNTTRLAKLKRQHKREG